MNDDPIAYFITWTCYGTLLPGATDGWTKWHKGNQVPQPLLEDWCRDRLNENPLVLANRQRQIVNQAVRDHCAVREWTLHAVNCRSNHCHVVVTAVDHCGEQVRDQLKSWATRRLNEELSACAMPSIAEGETADRRGRALPLNSDVDASKPRQRWWTRKGSVRHLFSDDSLDAAVIYTLEAQDQGGSKSS